MIYFVQLYVDYIYKLKLHLINTTLYTKYKITIYRPAAVKGLILLHLLNKLLFEY